MCSKSLNPYAQEWRPAPAVEVVVLYNYSYKLPSQCRYPFYFQGFIPKQAAPPALRVWRRVGKDVMGQPPKPSALGKTKTTVMIKNIPNQLRRDFMLDFMDSCCKTYSLEYDFFYLPMDFRKEDNLGYAFVNFTKSGYATKFKQMLQNYAWGSITTGGRTLSSKKICHITWATIQGKEGQIRRFRNSIFPCNNLQFLPVVMDPPRNGSNAHMSPPLTVGTLR